jgi:SAM-dependent methyltransferase
MTIPWPVRLYAWANRALALLEGGVRLARALHVGFWLGVLRREHLHLADELYYGGHGRYTDDAHNLSGLLGWEADAVDRHFGGVESVVVLGAGAGREVIALAERGLEVVGHEVHPALVAEGRRLLAERGLPATLEPMARDRCPELAGTFAGAVIGWAAYTHVQGRETRVRLLADLREHLVPGAPLLLSFLYRDGRERDFKLIAGLGSAVRRLLGREPLDEGDTVVRTYVHFFTRDEVRSELASAGYELLHHSTTGYGHAVARVA